MFHYMLGLFPSKIITLNNTARLKKKNQNSLKMSDCSKDKRQKPDFPKRQTAVSPSISVYRLTLGISALVKGVGGCLSSTGSFRLKNSLCW